MPRCSKFAILMAKLRKIECRTKETRFFFMPRCRTRTCFAWLCPRSSAKPKLRKIERNAKENVLFFSFPRCRTRTCFAWLCPRTLAKPRLLSIKGRVCRARDILPVSCQSPPPCVSAWYAHGKVMAVYALPQTSGDISFWFATTSALFCDNLFRNPS